MMENTHYLTQTHAQYITKRTPMNHRVHWLAHYHSNLNLVVGLITGCATFKDIQPVRDDPTITPYGTRWGVTNRYNDISIYESGQNKLEGYELPFYILRILQRTSEQTFFIDLSAQQSNDVDIYLGRIVVPPFGQNPILLDMARWTNKKIQNSLHLPSFKINPTTGFTYVQAP